MTDAETIRRLSAMEQREPALSLAEQAIRERDELRAHMMTLMDIAFEAAGPVQGYDFRARADLAYLKACDLLLRVTPAVSEARAFLHQRDR